MNKTHSTFAFRANQRTPLICAFATATLILPILSGAFAEQNGVSRKPALGWSSWSFIRNQPSESKIEDQALAMHNNLQSHGFQYINLDDYWYLNPSKEVDKYGRWEVDTSKFPHGIDALADYVHSLGLKFGIYVTPGIPVAAYKQNTPIEGTTYHARDIADTTRYETNYNFNYGRNTMYAIDYSKPGAQEFIDSWARLFASWGVDYLKLDGVGATDISDIQAWSYALNNSGRPIHFGLSNSLALQDGATWRAYTNSWRISGDVEAYLFNSSYGVYPLASWHNVFNHFVNASQWTQFGGPGGWNDLDSLEIGNGSYDGTNAGASLSDFFSQDERQTIMSWWTIAATQLLLGTDLTQNLDQFDYTLLQNEEVLAVDQAGVPGAPIKDYLNTDPDQNNGSLPEIWRSKQPDGTYAVVLSNLASTTQEVTASWTSFGFVGDAVIRDLWGHTNLVANPNINGGYKFTNNVSFDLKTRQSTLVKVTPLAPVTQYLADAPANTFTGGASVGFLGGGTQLGNNNAATDGRVATYVGNGGSVTFNKIKIPRAGTYTVNFLYFNGDPSRTATVSVNGGSPVTINFPGTGSFQTTGTLTAKLQFLAGNNSVTISAPGNSYAPDIDSINIPMPTTRYLADAAALSGGQIAVVSRTVCTDGKCVTNVGEGNSLTFTHVKAGESEKTKVIFLYLTGVARSADIMVNGSRPVAVRFPATGSDPEDFTKVGAVTVELRLSAGTNSITVMNQNAAAPDFDSILVAD